MTTDINYTKKLEGQVKSLGNEVEELTISTRKLNLENQRLILELEKNTAILQKAKADVEFIYSVFESKKIQASLKFVHDNKIKETHPYVQHAKKLIAEKNKTRNEQEAK